MKIGINLVGVSYNDGSNGGRYRNYKDAIEGFYKNVVNPLQKEGNEIFFYLFSYNNSKQEEIRNSYQPLKKSLFIDSNLNQLGGGDKVHGPKVMSVSYINSLSQLLEEDLDLVISTRFDINFYKNPFKEYSYDLNKCNFLWREPEFIHLPLVNDTFIVFPHSMTQNLIDAIIEMETNPPYNVNIGMHNLYLPLINQIGENQVQWVCNDFKTALNNDLYKLMRHE